MIEKRCKHTNSKYKDSHQKNAKSMHKHLTRSSVPDTIFSDKRQATSDKRQATSDKRQSGINSAQINLNINYSNHAQRQPAGQRPLFCPWAFFIHRLIKPQRTQRTQRNIKECLTKPLLKHLCEVERKLNAWRAPRLN